MDVEEIANTAAVLAGKVVLVRHPEGLYTACEGKYEIRPTAGTGSKWWRIVLVAKQINKNGVERIDRRGLGDYFRDLEHCRGFITEHHTNRAAR